MKKRGVCRRALCEEHSPIPAQELGQSGVNSVIISKESSIRESFSGVSSRAHAHVVLTWTGPLKECYLLLWATLSSLQTLKIKRCFIKWVPEASSEARDQCPSRQLSLGWHLQGNTLGQVWIRSSEVPSSQRSSLLTHLVELCEDAARTAPKGIPLRQIFCSHEQVTMLNVLLVSQTFIF